MLEYNSLLDSFMTGVSCKSDHTKEIITEETSYLEYQPIVCGETYSTVFYECLFRYTSSDNSYTTSELIRRAEKLGLCYQIDTYVFSRAIKELLTYPELKLSINVSKTSLINDLWLKSVKRFLSGISNLDGRLILEVTETSQIEDFNKTLVAMDVLKQYGCLLALDDYGAGYTSFNQLRSLPFDIVKIDKSCLRDLHHENSYEKTRDLLFQLSNFCRDSNIETIIEGVEDGRCLDKIADFNVAYLQGYIFGHPSPWHKYNFKINMH